MKNDNLLACEIVHRIRGRIRIKSKAFKYIGASLKTEIEKQLVQVRYIESVEISLITGTILIYFEYKIHLTHIYLKYVKMRRLKNHLSM